MNFDKWICELMGVDYICVGHTDTSLCVDDEYCHQRHGKCVYNPSYGDLHRAKDIINERGEWVIENLFDWGYLFKCIDVRYGKKLESFYYKTAKEAEGALREALAYVKENSNE